MAGDVITETNGTVGRIVLTRPKAMNALTHEMALEIEAALDAWACDEASAVLLTVPIGS